MIRKIIRIAQEKCNGCGLCAAACHEGAIEMINGKAVLTREDYCDGLGDCLPACPTGAISFEEREAPAYNEAAVLAAKVQKVAVSPCGCPGAAAAAVSSPCASSQLSQWPIQIKLVPVCAPFFDGADLLIAADCTAYAYGRFHDELMHGHVTLIGCPKLDATDYSEKLTGILIANNIRSITVARMNVPCCGGIENAVRQALRSSGKQIPWRTVTISTDGRRLS